MRCKRCRITGRVQGVFFRASAREEVQRLGVSGYARNLADGSVEVVACGEAEAVDSLCRWLRQGPPQARVDRCESEEITNEVHTGFSIS